MKSPASRRGEGPSTRHRLERPVRVLRQTGIGTSAQHVSCGHLIKLVRSATNSVGSLRFVSASAWHRSGTRPSAMRVTSLEPRLTPSIAGRGGS